MIDKLTAERIKEAADIVDVVSDYVKLTRRGANYMGLCPFHNERTPSFSVNKSKNFCYCFSCHKGGSPVNFIMEKEGIGYQDALRQLAAKYGIKIEEREQTDEERRAQSERESMMLANQWAMEHMVHNLTETEEGRNIGLQYFYSRGITPEAIKAFRLGYAIDKGSDLTQAARKAGYNLELLHKLGLIGKSKEGHEYDRFRGRVIFPILNSAGKVLAFGGRDLKGGPAKYINSPESPVYKKSNELYGLYQAKNAIVKSDKCFLVEGYMDVIGMWQSGMQNVIASSGTALTDGQIALIHRFTNKVTLIYDGDAAGIKASLRGIDMLLSHNLDLSILLLPDGEDPDSFSRKHTPEEFQEYVKENEQDFIGFKTKVLLNEAAENPIRRTEAVKSIIQSLSAISDKTKRAVYLRECSRLLEISEEILAAETAKLREGIVQEIRKGREINRLNNIDDKTQPVSKSNAENDTPQTTNTTDYVRSHLLDKLERKVLTYCIKYGMRSCTESGPDNTGDTDETVISLVRSDMDINDIQFSNPLHARIFQLAENLQEKYKEDQSVKLAFLEAEADRIRSERYAEISSKNLDLSGLEKSEAEVEASLAEFIQSRIDDFATDYISKILASHEDDEVRKTVVELITEKHKLSKYHLKRAHIQTEEERLVDLLFRSLNEWKQGILQENLSMLLSELSKAEMADNLEEIVRLQKEIYEYEQVRRQFASSTGDRVILPKSH